MERMRRVNELIKRELGLMFERLICPEVDCLVTITEVRTSPDLRQSQVYVSVFGSGDQRKTVLSLMLNKRKEMQHILSKNVKLKYTPKLTFHIDETAESADRVTQLLAELEKDTQHDDD